MGFPSLSDFDAEARARLVTLTHEGATLLAVEARAARDAAKEESWPTDPQEAARAVGSILGASPTVEVDEGLEEIEESLHLARLILSHEDELSGRDCRALAWLLGRAETLIGHEVAAKSAARRRLHHIAEDTE